MKITEIATGIVYWYETAQEWGNYLTPDYSRFPAVRVDDKRYQPVGRSSVGIDRLGREDPKGRYVAIRQVTEDGQPVDGTKIQYVQSTFVRGTMTAVRERVEQATAARRADREQTARDAAAAAERAAALTARVEALGLADVFTIRATTGQGWKAGQPVVIVSLGHDAETALSVLLDRLESAARPVA